MQQAAPLGFDSDAAAVNAAAGPQPPDPRLLAEQSLWQRWTAERDADAREQLICLFLPYARIIAATLYGRRTHGDVDFADYLQLASMGLVESVERFDPQMGVQFKTYASKRMQGAILSGLERLTEKNQQIAVRRRLRQERLQAVKSQAAQAAAPPGASHPAETGPGAPATPRRSQQALFSYLAEVGVGLALGVLLEGTGMVDEQAMDRAATSVSPEVSYFQQRELLQLQQRVKELVGRLAAQEQLVIRYHYLQEVPFDEIAALLGVTRSRVSQLHRQGLKSLRGHLAERSRCDTLW
jgi:RNA polymerase sigma factor for flagellar operon FliA